MFPLLEMEFWGMMSIGFGLFLANVGGVGGGGIVFPLSMIFLKFDTKNAIGLSNFSIWLSSFLRYIIFIK